MYSNLRSHDMTACESGICCGLPLAFANSLAASWDISLCVAVCCSMLRYVAVCCCQRTCFVAVCCSVLLSANVGCHFRRQIRIRLLPHETSPCMLHRVAVCCSVLQSAVNNSLAASFDLPPSVALCCSVLQWAVKNLLAVYWASSRAFYLCFVYKHNRTRKYALIYTYKLKQTHAHTHIHTFLITQDLKIHIWDNKTLLHTATHRTSTYGMAPMSRLLTTIVSFLNKRPPHFAKALLRQRYCLDRAVKPHKTPWVAGHFPQKSH